MKLLRQEVLSDLEYYGMRLSGTEDLKIHKGLEVGQELDKIIIYGDIAEQYSKLGNKRQAIGFAPTIDIAQKCVNILNTHGFDFRLIHGKMSLSERQRLIKLLTTCKINGLVNAALLTYGFDAP